MSNATMITIAGNLADAPELKVTPNGKATSRMRVAVDSRHRDATGEWVDGATAWYTVIAWDHLAENLTEQLAKGDRVLVHGRLEQREWTTEAGEIRTIWEVTAEDAGPSLRMPAHATTPNRQAPARPTRQIPPTPTRQIPLTPTRTPARTPVAAPAARRSSDNRRSAARTANS